MCSAVPKHCCFPSASLPHPSLLVTYVASPVEFVTKNPTWKIYQTTCICRWGGLRAGSCALCFHSPFSSIHAVLLVCPCREHHDDSDGVHGERSAGLFPQGECCVLAAGLHHLLRLQQASLSSSFSSSSFLSFLLFGFICRNTRASSRPASSSACCWGSLLA